MAATDKAFTGSIAEIYHRDLVPLIFEPYALDLAKRVESFGSRQVLETAAGTGVATRAIASILPKTASLIATDLNQAMIDVAHRSLSSDARIQWMQADACQLPFPDHSFDAVICQFGAMFFPDKVQGFSEARRVLNETSGKFIFSVWNGIDQNEFADVVTDALLELFPHDPPLFLARTPHGYHDADRIRRELLEAGFCNVEIDVVEHVSRCTSPQRAAVAYCQGTPLRNEIVVRDAHGLERATQRATDALARRFGSRSIEGKILGTVLTARV